jgi:hypothetical protein
MVLLNLCAFGPEALEDLAALRARRRAPEAAVSAA